MSPNLDSLGSEILGYSCRNRIEGPSDVKVTEIAGGIFLAVIILTFFPQLLTLVLYLIMPAFGMIIGGFIGATTGTTEGVIIGALLGLAFGVLIDFKLFGRQDGDKRSRGSGRRK